MLLEKNATLEKRNRISGKKVVFGLKKKNKSDTQT